MAVSFIRDQPFPLLEARSHRPPRDVAGALLAAIESVQQAVDARELTDRIALSALSLSGAAFALVYLEIPRAEPLLAVMGAIDESAVEPCATMLKALISSGGAAPYLLLAHGATLVAPFGGERLRGGVLVERQGGTFDEADARVLAQFARHAGAATASMSLRGRVRRIERLGAAALDILREPVLIAVDGRVHLLNHAAVELLGADRERVMGSAVEKTWPQLDPLLKAGKGVDAAPQRIAGKDLLVTLRRISDSSQPDTDVITFVEANAAPPRPRAAPAHDLFALEDVVGDSPGVRRARELALVAAGSDSSLLIEGESGVGKEVLAQAIHSSGSRRDGPFIAVHCAAIPRDLLESELFGYDKGAFTGASPHGHAGKFELAQGGTLLLDDVVELPCDMQAKLLRVLQEKSVTRLGGSRPRRVDVRVVATSNVPLREAIDAGRFRADLFYRLNVLSIAVPALRDRKEDLRPLGERFLRRYSPLHGRQLRTVGADALRELESYAWPGNVRELEHWLESEVHFAPPDAVCLERLARPLPRAEERRPVPAVRPVREVERELYAAAVAACEGDLTRAARELGVSRGRLYRKLRLYGVCER